MSIKGDTGTAMRRRGSVKAASLLVGVAILGLSTAGCAKINSVVALFKFKQANQAYQAQDYERPPSSTKKPSPATRTTRSCTSISATATTTCTSRARRGSRRTTR